MDAIEDASSRIRARLRSAPPSLPFGLCWHGCFSPPTTCAGDFKFEHYYIEPESAGTSYGQICLVDWTRTATATWRGETSTRRQRSGSNIKVRTSGRGTSGEGPPLGCRRHGAGCGRRRIAEPRDRVSGIATQASHARKRSSASSSTRNKLRARSRHPRPRWRWASRHHHHLIRRIFAGIVCRRIRRHPRVRRDIGPGVQADVAVEDIDGDGDLDVARSNAWFENGDGRGTQWMERKSTSPDWLLY
jgi:hypothetical protein